MEDYIGECCRGYKGGYQDPPPPMVWASFPLPCGWLWLEFRGMKRHDLRSSLLSCGCGWVWVLQMEEYASHC